MSKLEKYTILHRRRKLLEDNILMLGALTDKSNNTNSLDMSLDLLKGVNHEIKRMNENLLAILIKKHE